MDDDYPIPDDIPLLMVVDWPRSLRSARVTGVLHAAGQPSRVTDVVVEHSRSDQWVQIELSLRDDDRESWRVGEKRRASSNTVYSYLERPVDVDVPVRRSDLTEQDWGA